MTPPAAKIQLPDRFRVSRHVADGGMASVWAAEDRTLRRMVAIKLLAARFLGDENAVRRFEREARAAASLSSHPHVVTIYDVGEYDGQPFIVMEYMSGGTLADRLRGNGRPRRDDVLRWLSEAASALDFAHEMGVVHRDVKPGNLLLDERGRLGVTDFGIARAAFDATVTATGEVLGTAAYLSPEQAEGDPGGPASDRYALAVVAYELLTGSRPFRGGSFAAQVRQHVEAEPRPPSQQGDRELAGGADRVLLRGLDKDPDARWPTATEMVDALASSLGHAQADDTPPTVALGTTAATTPLEREEPTERRGTRVAPAPAAPPAPAARRRWAAPAAAAAAIGLALLALALLGGDDQRAGQRPADRPATQPQRTQPAPAEPADSGGEADLGRASQLNQEGYELMQQGRFEDAVKPLREAVEICGDSTVVDPCAYALFNLGSSLRQAGRPKEAIPILKRRLQIPNQTETVRRELALAEQQAAGGTEPSGGGEESGDDEGGGPPPGRGRGNGKEKRKRTTEPSGG